MEADKTIKVQPQHAIEDLDISGSPSKYHRDGFQNQVKFVGQAFLTVANNEFDLGAATTDAQFPASQFLRSMAQLPAHL